MKMRGILPVLVLGILAGGTAVSVFHAARLDRLYWEKEKLMVQLFETTERLSRLQSLWESGQSAEIIAVTIRLNGDVNEFVLLELERTLNEMTAGLIGENIDNLNPDLLRQLVDRRKITVEDKDYLVTVRWIILGRETIFSLDASPVP